MTASAVNVISFTRENASQVLREWPLTVLDYSIVNIATMPTGAIGAGIGPKACPGAPDNLLLTSSPTCQASWCVLLGPCKTFLSFVIRFSGADAWSQSDHETERATIATHMSAKLSGKAEYKTETEGRLRRAG